MSEGNVLGSKLTSETLHSLFKSAWVRCVFDTDVLVSAPNHDTHWIADLLVLRPFHGIPILAANEFLRLLESQ
jgi:hypothetical protein